MIFVDIKPRSNMMAKIKSKNTKPDLTVRSLLHHLGFYFRFRIHMSDGLGTEVRISCMRSNLSPVSPKNIINAMFFLVSNGF